MIAVGLAVWAAEGLVDEALALRADHGVALKSAPLFPFVMAFVVAIFVLVPEILRQPRRGPAR